MAHSVRNCTLTEKGADFNSTLLGEHTKIYESLYSSWKSLVRAIKSQLKCLSSEEIVAQLIDDLEVSRAKATHQYNFIHPVPRLIKVKQDTINSVSDDLLRLLRLHISEDLDSVTRDELARLRYLCVPGYAKSVYESRVSSRHSECLRAFPVNTDGRSHAQDSELQWLSAPAALPQPVLPSVPPSRGTSVLSTKNESRPILVDHPPPAMQPNLPTPPPLPTSVFPQPSSMPLEDQFPSASPHILNCQDEEEEPIPGADGEAWCIPRPGVYHPKKFTKISVMFDSSANYIGTSLNDHLLTGPDLTKWLLGAFMRFREHSIVIVCDIEKMFHQFPVANKDFLSFLWWEGEDTNKEPKGCRMKVHLFGDTSSTGCANYGLKSLATKNESLYPLACRFLSRNFHVNDGIACIPSLTEALKFVQEATELCGTNGMRLHKFVSNDKQAFKGIPVPVSERAPAANKMDITASVLPDETALGIKWFLEEESSQSWEAWKSYRIHISSIKVARWYHPRTF